MPRDCSQEQVPQAKEAVFCKAGLVGLLWMSLFLCEFGAKAQVLSPILVTGPETNRYTVTLLSEGYTSNQGGLFLADATNAVAALLNREPFSSCAGLINAYAISVPSVQSGADHPAYGSYRNTYFNATYDAASDSLVTIPPNAFDTDYTHGQGKLDALLVAFTPRCRLPILLVNDLTPGGSDAGGRAAITYRGAGMGDYLLHEAGHIVAGLGDEYSTSHPGFPSVEEPNTTTNVALGNLRWAAWVTPGTPIPTPPTQEYANSVGLFEGAHYHARGWYRPKLDCAMNHPTFPAFCEVCREALLLGIYRFVQPADAVSPRTGEPIRLSPAQSVDLTVLLAPGPGPLAVQWFTNGAAWPDATNNFVHLSAGQLGPGAHTVQALIRDTTPFVRNDPGLLLRQTLQWQLRVEPGPTNVPMLRLEIEPGPPAQTFVFRAVNTSITPLEFILQTATAPGTSGWSSLSTNSLAAGAAVSFTNLVEPGPRFFRAALSP